MKSTSVSRYIKIINTQWGVGLLGDNIVYMLWWDTKYYHHKNKNNVPYWHTIVK